jgi:glycosyltransferase involved in cell wall biosynthesis
MSQCRKATKWGTDLSGEVMSVLGAGGPHARGLGRPVRVLFVCNRYLPELGGVETHVREVAQRLVREEDLEVTVLATDRSRTLPRDDVINGTPVVRVPAWPRRRDYYFAPQVLKVAGQRGRWDLVHCQGIHSPVPVMAMLAARRAGIPYLVTFHTGGHSQALRNRLRPAQWRMLGPLLRDAAALIGVSQFEARTLSKDARLARDSIRVIRNGGTLPPAAPGTVPIPGRIVSSGRLERYKGHHRVIEALPHIVAALPDAHVVILGSGTYETQLVELAQRLRVADRVTIRSIDPDDRVAMANALAEANVVAALSDYEAHPVGIMEALSVGRPVVGYETSGIAELVAAGWVHGINPRSAIPYVARQIAAAMSSPEMIDPNVLPTWDGCAKQLGDLYRSLVGPAATFPAAV